MPSESPVVELVALPEADPATCHAMQRHLLKAVGEGRRPPTLCVFSLLEEFLALGRFHVAPQARGGGLFRRLSGGRVLPFGPGHVGLALILPRRDAMTGSLPGALSAPQVMNRHVRGFLEGCRAIGIDPLYPGRDVVTLGKRMVATLGLETERSGAAVFEMVIARSRPFDGLGELVAGADPDGLLNVGLPNGDQITDLERELGRSLSFDQLVETLRRGFARQLGATVVRSDLREEDRKDVRTLAEDRRGFEEWVFGRRRSPAATHRGTNIGPGGALDIYFEDRGGVLGELTLSGDFIASAGTIARLEAALSGCRRDPDAIDRQIKAACSAPGDYLLGVEPSTALRDAIMRAIPC